MRCAIYFNPRSHEGSNRRNRESYFDFGNFNPRSHEGSDPKRYNIPPRRNRISIRAPTRGATRVYMTAILPQLFQSALPRGERRISKMGNRSAYHFNPRSHEGSDSGVSHRFFVLGYFNPRSHEGSDLPFLQYATTG